MRMRLVMMQMCEKAFEAYRLMLEAGLAREVARNVLPLATYTQFFFKTNARSLMNFLSLRNASNAMHEIQLYAQAIEEFFQKRCPITYEAFVKNGRVAP